jgi:predicted acyltransferase
MTSTMSPHPAPARLRFLDAARALAVLSMLAANLVNVFMPERPPWLGHNMGDQLLPLDLPAPIFQFLVGVSLVLFLARRQADGDREQARWLAVRRFSLLVLLGVLLDAVAAGRVEFRWGVLQTLGLGGLVATALAGLPDAIVLLIAVTIAATHYGPGNNAVHRSALDCLPFLPLTLVGLVVGRPLAAGAGGAFRRRVLAAAAACLALAVALRVAGIPFNKVTGTSSFVALAAAAASALLGALHALEERGELFSETFLVLGSNALTAWALQYLLVFYPVGLLHPPAPPEAGGFVVVAAVVLVLSALTVACGRRGLRIPL